MPLLVAVQVYEFPVATARPTRPCTRGRLWWRCSSSPLMRSMPQIGQTQSWRLASLTSLVGQVPDIHLLPFPPVVP